MRSFKATPLRQQEGCRRPTGPEKRLSRKPQGAAGESLPEQVCSSQGCGLAQLRKAPAWLQLPGPQQAGASRKHPGAGQGTWPQPSLSEVGACATLLEPGLSFVEGLNARASEGPIQRMPHPHPAHRIQVIICPPPPYIYSTPSISCVGNNTHCPCPQGAHILMGQSKRQYTCKQIRRLTTEWERSKQHKRSQLGLVAREVLFDEVPLSLVLNDVKEPGGPRAGGRGF